METVIGRIHPVEEISVSDILSADMEIKDFAVLGFYHRYVLESSSANIQNKQKTSGY